jgi:hypothetical protein
MKFEDSKLSKEMNYKKINLSFGNFFFLDNFIISEINRGIHFDWKKIKKISKLIIEHYGKDCKIGYVSNRINSYSFEPKLWIDFNNRYGFIIAAAIITYDNYNRMNANIEKKFSGHSLKRCNNLDQAIDWVNNLKEFN